MAQVSEEKKAKVTNFLDSLPNDQISKCSLCNETLTHIVKLGEVEAGAGSMTVCRALAELVNRTATANESVTPKALNNRVRRTEGKGSKFPKRENTPVHKNSDKPNDIAYNPSSDTLSPGNVTNKIISGRKLIIEGLDLLEKMVSNNMLQGDEIFREAENQLRLVNSVAQDLHLRI